MVSDIQVQDVLRVLQPIWTDKTVTANRVRGRIEAVLSWATVSGHRTGDNPARWAGNLKELLPAAFKVAKGENHPAVALDDAPISFAALRAREGFGARALEFAAMTAARSGEFKGAAWSKIDLDKALWVIPADGMKMSREHRVPLSYAAVALLQALPRLDGNDLVFPAARGGQLSDMTLSATMRRIHQAEMTPSAPALWIAPLSALPCSMVCAAHSAIGLPSAQISRAIWPRLPWRTRLAAPWKVPIGAVT